ncbi:MAG: cystathionine beta-lyase [Rhodospirillales bacterium]
MKKDTLLTHAGRDPEAYGGAVNTPVYHVSTVVFPDVESLLGSSARPHGEMSYGRRGTPTTFALEQAVAALEGGDGCVLTPSGLAAVVLALETFLSPGDHLLMVDSAYGPTRGVCEKHLKPRGILVDYYDPRIGGGIKDLIRPETRVVYMESPGSWTFEVQDVPAIAEAARRAGAVSIIDNTWSGGYFLDALGLGCDVSVQAATKYIVGHADVMMGTVTAAGEACERLRAAWNARGLASGPDDCYLALRGLRSMAVRLARHQETALRLAEWLEAQPLVESVLHPALPSSPDHALWKRDFTGASGLFGFTLKPSVPQGAANALAEERELYSMGFSWGGFESLLIPTFPAKIRTATAWEAGPAFRLHAGLEDPDDLLDDLKAGFQRLESR